MQALGMIETKGLLAAIEAADTMLKAADVALFEKQKVGGGRVTVLVTGDVAAVKAAVDAGAMAAKQIQTDCLLSCHVIPRPHDETMKLFEYEEDIKPGTAKPGTAETAKPAETKSEEIKIQESIPDTPVKKSESWEKAEPKSSKKNREKQE